MKKLTKLTIAVFALAMGLSLTAFSQDTSSQPSDKQQGSSAQTSDQQGSTATQSGSESQSSMPSDQTTSSDKKAGNAKLHHLKGTIGQDGKSFTSDKDQKTWDIMNPEAVKGHEGHHVVLDAHVYKDKNAVHVMGVKMMGEKSSKSEDSGKSDNKPMSEQPPPKPY